MQRSITSSSLEATPTGLAPVRSVTNFHMQKVQSDILFSPFFSLPPSSVSLRRTHTLNQHVWISPRNVSLPPSIRARVPPSSLFHGCCLGWLVGWLAAGIHRLPTKGRLSARKREEDQLFMWNITPSPHPHLLFHIPKVWFPDLSIVLWEALHHRHTRQYRTGWDVFK